jgi:uncharacterized membrane protein
MKTVTQKIGDLLAQFASDHIGSWRFVFVMTVLFVGCIVWRAYAPLAWQFDTPEFFRLNLALSFLAGYTASIILIATKLQDRMTHQILHTSARHIQLTHDDMRRVLREHGEMKAALERIEKALAK